jgi:hypothetical protein
MEGTSLGGELVLVSACLTVSPLITGGQAHTHTLRRPSSDCPQPGMHGQPGHQSLVCTHQQGGTLRGPRPHPVQLNVCDDRQGLQGLSHSHIRPQVCGDCKIWGCWSRINQARWRWRRWRQKQLGGWRPPPPVVKEREDDLSSSDNE